MAGKHQPESAAFEVLRQYLQARAELSAQEFDLILSAFLSRRRTSVIVTPVD
jgi:hypothetical protein